MTNADEASTPPLSLGDPEEELTAAGELERYEEQLRSSQADTVPRENEPASFQAARLMQRLFTDADPPSEPLVPTSLGRFQIRELLGTGRFGVVWRAFDPNTGRDVAIKVVRPNPAFDADVRRRFLRECHLAARINHPGIVPVYDVSTVGDCLYLV
ncbi:MAG: protein kinase, partial [Planctomycetaceae bacterium]|nr:protein kinase [Planctomycetaceae bacterium]